jgi:hypothetical protein
VAATDHENLFARLKNWCRLGLLYGRREHTFFSTICIAATPLSGSANKS